MTETTRTTEAIDYYLMVPLWTIDAIVLMVAVVLIVRTALHARDESARREGFSSARARRRVLRVERQNARFARRNARIKGGTS
jgi:hypothetical protein